VRTGGLGKERVLCGALKYCFHEFYPSHTHDRFILDSYFNSTPLLW
jgi:hypothetical protein